jgi:hypothetical protein
VPACRANQTGGGGNVHGRVETLDSLREWIEPSWRKWKKIRTKTTWNGKEVELSMAEIQNLVSHSLISIFLKAEGHDNRIVILAKPYVVLISYGLLKILQKMKLLSAN